MRPRLRQRLVETAVLAVVVTLAAWAYTRVVRPDPRLLLDMAQARLKEIFGPGVSYRDFQIDVLEGVVIHDLEVKTAKTNEPTLEARRVEVRHDLLALASGVYRPTQIVIDGAKIVTHETETGIALDFPFELEPTAGAAVPPQILVRDGKLLCRAREDSTRLASRYVLVLDRVDLSVVPKPDGLLHVDGGFHTKGLGQDDVRIDVQGTADTGADTLELAAVWNPMRITPSLLGVLAPPMAKALESQKEQSGRLVVSLTSHPDVDQGQIQVKAAWTGSVHVDIATLPGAERIDATTLEQLQAILGRADLAVEVSKEGIDIQGLATALGGGDVHATGRIEEGGRHIELLVEVKGLRLENPDVRAALGSEGAKLFDTFEPSGAVDARIHLHKEPDGPLEWSVDALLEDASFRYVGSPDENGVPQGFPYRVEQATGHVRIQDGEVLFDDIVGFNGRATVRVLSSREESWMGGPTGRIKLSDKGAEIHLTVQAVNVPVDHELAAAVQGSEFAGLLDRYRLQGVIDRIEVDIVRIAGVDPKAYTQVRIGLANERFEYAQFPLPLEDVTGWITYTRPFRPDKTRARVFQFAVDGRVDGAPAHVEASFHADEERGRLRIRSEGVPLAGSMAHAILEADATKEGLARVWRFLDPRGHADVTADFPLEEDPGPLHLRVALQGASVRLDAAHAATPLEVDRLTGTLTVEGSRVELDDLRGRMGPGLEDTPVGLKGAMDGGPEGRWDLSVTTGVLRVTPELLHSVSDLAGGASLIPLRIGRGSRMALEIHLTREPGEESLVEAAVVATRLDVDVTLPEGTSLTLRGQRLAVEKGSLSAEGLRAEGAGIALDIEQGRLEGGHSVGHYVLHLDGFRAGRSLLGLLPGQTGHDLAPWIEDRMLTTRALEIDAAEDGSVRLAGDLTVVAPSEASPGGAPRGQLELRPLSISAPDATGVQTLSGHVLFHGFTLGEDVPVEDLFGAADVKELRLGVDPRGEGVIRAEHAKIEDLTVKDLVVPIHWRDGILRAQPITGILEEGRLTGRFLLHTRKPGGYEGDAQIRDFSVSALRNDLAPTGPAYAGIGQATVVFANRGTDVRDLTAQGHVSIRKGNLGDLPIVANFFTLLSGLLGMRDPPRFQSADADFTLEDEVVHFSKLDLVGPLFELPGTGTVDLGGLVDLTFTPDIIKSLAVPGVMQLPGIGDLLDAFLREDLLYAIRLRGDIASARPEIVVLPPLGLGSDRPFEGTGVPEPPPRRIPRWFR